MNRKVCVAPIMAALFISATVIADGQSGSGHSFGGHTTPTYTGSISANSNALANAGGSPGVQTYTATANFVQGHIFAKQPGQTSQNGQITGYDVEASFVGSSAALNDWTTGPSSAWSNALGNAAVSVVPVHLTRVQPMNHNHGHNGHGHNGDHWGDNHPGFNPHNFNPHDFNPHGDHDHDE